MWRRSETGDGRSQAQFESGSDGLAPKRPPSVISVCFWRPSILNLQSRTRFGLKGGPMSRVCRHEPLPTGIEPIDTQHRELYEVLGGLAESIGSGAPAVAVDEDLAQLARHTIRHCQTEESLMKDAGFPDRIVHANQHLDLILQIRDLQYQRAKGRPVGQEAVARLGDWLDHHILDADRAYVTHLKAHLHV